MKRFVSGGLLLIMLLAGCQFGKEPAALSEQPSQEQTTGIVTKMSATALPPLTSTSTSSPTPAPAPVRLTPTVITSDQPTVLPTPSSSDTAEIRIEISAGSRTVKVGDVITVTAVPVGIGMPYYTLNINSNPVVTITYDNQVKYQGDTGQFVELVSASATHSQIQFVLQALRPGTIEVSIGATGEVRIDYGDGTGAWSWGGAASENITITIIPTEVTEVPPIEEPIIPPPIGEPDPTGQFDESVDAIFIQDNYAYINTGPRLTILDITTPLHPASVGSTGLPKNEGPGIHRAFVSDIYVADGYAYVAAYESGLRIIDVSNPTTPREVGVYQPPLLNWNDFPSIQSPDPPRHMFREGARGVFVRRETGGQTYAYVAAYAAGLRVVDVSDPTTPIEVGIYEYELPAAPTSVTVRDNYAYVAAGKGGLRVMDISDPTAPDEISALTTELNWSWDVVVADRDSARLAYLAEGYCDGMSGCHGGLRVVDVSSPDSPIQIVPASISGGISLAVTLTDNYAYLTGASALRAIDLSEPTRSVGRWTATHTSLFIRDVAVVNSYAYLAAGREGLQILPISHLSTPSETKSGTGEPDHSSWMTYTSDDEPGGQFSIQYPADYELIYEVPSVGGIWTVMTNTVTIFSGFPTFALSIEYETIETDTPLAQFIDQKSQCVEISAEQGQPFTLGGQEALIFVDPNCGPAGNTEIYTLHNGFGYRILVWSSAKYKQTKEHVEPILSTFKFTLME